MTAVVYATREDVKAAQNSSQTARNNSQVDRALDSASRAVEGLTHRKFYPQLDTRTFTWPSRGRFWLDANELISVTTLTADGVSVSAADYDLGPISGPPFSYLEVDTDSVSGLYGTDLVLTGFYGYSADLEIVGTLTDTLAADAATTTDVSFTSPRVGVGTILKVDDEYMIVTDRTMVDSGQNLQTPLTASAANVTVAVADGTAFADEDVLLLDSERMLVVDVAGNNLTVKRAWDGSVLASHTGSDIYALTGLGLSRGQLGTTAAAHSASDVIYRHVVPGPVRDLTIAEALNQLEQEASGYARTIGSGEGTRNVSYAGLEGLRNTVYARYGRKARMRTV